MSPEHSLEQIKAAIRNVEDFPKAGILFKDITPILADPGLFESLIGHMAKSVPRHATKIAAIESRGFILGSALAHQLGIASS